LLDQDDELPQTLSYFILNKLRWRIIVGDLLPGQALREVEIQSHYGSSRGPVRESLRLLLQHGLVEHQQRRGFRVKSYPEKETRDLYTLRASLEGSAISSLKDRDLTELCRTLMARLQLMEAHWNNKDRDGYFRENVVFHQNIINFTENQPLIRVLHIVNEISLPLRYNAIRLQWPKRTQLEYHFHIAEYLGKGDLEPARQLTEEHILSNIHSIPSDT